MGIEIAHRISGREGCMEEMETLERTETEEGPEVQDRLRRVPVC